MPITVEHVDFISIPTRDVERSKRFYAEQLGWRVDNDVQNGPMRAVQLTPPGSACSVTIGPARLSDTAPGEGRARLQLVVPDIDAARAELIERGIDASPVTRFGAQGPEEGHGGDYNSFVFFSDPDGNSWAVQQISAR
jgi:catechol 2,3-dioxygenase-like lactoylglutathione lyase family enzyme